ncbi:hypothetical protein [Fundidesulfovibrio magnetotacticus]|uniref:hypothetical protein n=1 Tax=Fundidesulfovibrio magnetotacticus TaxID=2730080 RepID=UPI0015650D15|nr:hypothetical protein [Fundidesulfovibrio magnetotacticus]
MTHCQDVDTDFGGYSRALAAYTGMKAGSYFVRSGRFVGRGTRESAAALAQAGKLMLASVEYGGMVSASLVKRGGQATGDCVCRLFTPVANAATAPFRAIHNTVGRMFSSESKAQDSKTLHEIVERLSRIEERLGRIEEQGVRAVVAPVRAEAPKPETKKLSKDRQAFLRALVNENLAIRKESGK